MATELRTFTWCDVHLSQKDEQVEATSWMLSADPMVEPRTGTPAVFTVDLCDDCAADFALMALQELIEEHGVDGQGKRRRRRPAAAKKAAPAAQANAAPRAEEELACPECGETFADRNRLGAHGRKAHGRTIAELLGEETPYVCEDCGSGFGVPQALARHRGSAHG